MVKTHCVFNTGALGIDNIVNTKLLTKAELEKEPRIKFCKKFIMVGFHRNCGGEYSQTCDNMLGALNDLRIQLSFYAAKRILYGSLIWATMLNFDKKDNCYLFRKLGCMRYLSCLANCDILIGNSSSGILEAPFLGITR